MGGQTSSQLWEGNLPPSSPSLAGLEDVGHLQFNKKSLSSPDSGEPVLSDLYCLHQTMTYEPQKAGHMPVCAEQEKPEGLSALLA